MASIFTKIIQGTIPCYKVAENDCCFAFLDINPLQKGHVLVIPKKEVNQLFDLNDTDYSELMAFSKTIAIAIKKAFPCNRVGMAVIGLEVPHAHVHLIPITNMDDMNFANPKLNFDENTFKNIAKLIRQSL